MLKTGQLVLLVSPKGKHYFRVPRPGEVLNTHDGTIQMDEVIDVGFGGEIKTHLGRVYTVLRPSLYDVVKGVRRKTQILYPKEIGYLVMKLGIGPGARVVEAGCGSGGLTTALAWFVGTEGRVVTHDRRPEFCSLCRDNLEWAGMADRVEIHERDVGIDGFAATDADALFLDVRTPWEYLDKIPACLVPGSPLGFLLPTTNQVQELLAGLERGPFLQIEVLEILLRRYKPTAERFRPMDRMVAHTGFLVFARLAGANAVSSECVSERSGSESVDVFLDFS
ncbi:MAG: tRNA (adenine-N1)-methyltransferase [Deltaproteobacteria bacterium]|nr:tRNA (adenine-N1)-methyltransferase [Deltaproteobacteria bacterium]